MATDRASQLKHRAAELRRIQAEGGGVMKTDVILESRASALETAGKHLPASPKIASGYKSLSKDITSAATRDIRESDESGTVSGTIDGTRTAYKGVQAVAKAPGTIKIAAANVIRTGQVVKGAAAGAIKTAGRGYNAAKDYATGKKSVADAYRKIAADPSRYARGAVRGAVRGTTKAATYSVVKGIPGGAKLGARGLTGAGNYMQRTDDEMVNTTGSAAKGGVHAGRFAKAGVKTGVKAARGVKRGAQGAKAAVAYARKHGARMAAKAAAAKAKTALLKAGGSLVNLGLSAIKAVATKLILPILIVVGGFLIIVVVINSGGAIVGTLFGGSMGIMSDGDMGEVVVREMLLEDSGIPRLREELAHDIANELISLSSDNHVVRFAPWEDVLWNSAYDSAGDAFGIIDGTLPHNYFFADIIAPILISQALERYDFSPSTSEALALLDGIWEHLFITDVQKFVEHCVIGDYGILLGEGEPWICSRCGHRYARHGQAPANEDCPNYYSGVHPEYTCSTCCSYRTEEGEDDEDEDVREVHHCSGYYHCMGHDVAIHTLDILDFAGIMDIAFFEEIRYLSGISRTPEQERRLNNLRDFALIAEINFELAFVDRGVMFGVATGASLEIEMGTVQFLNHADGIRAFRAVGAHSMSVMTVTDLWTGLQFHIRPAVVFSENYHIDWIPASAGATAFIHQNFGFSWRARPAIISYGDVHIVGGYHTYPHHVGGPGGVGFTVPMDSTWSGGGLNDRSRRGQDGHACFHMFNSFSRSGIRYQSTVLEAWAIVQGMARR